MNKLEFRVNGMTCSQCEQALSSEVTAIHGVTGASVDAVLGVVVLRYSDVVERAAIEEAVSEAGFEIASWENESS